MKCLFTVFIMTNLFFISEVLAGYFDTGYIQWEQPDGAQLTARLWGDEFDHQMQTKDGYSIMMGKGGYYCYAIPSANGITVPSDKIVGVDAPEPESYFLCKSSSMNGSCEDQRSAFNEQLRLNGLSYKQLREITKAGAITINLGVILVDFTPSRRYVSNPEGNFPNGYQKHYFDHLIFSENSWIGNPRPPLYETPHPENQALFGSLQDYYMQQSRGKLYFSGKNGQPEILNALDPTYPNDPVPKWVQLPHSFDYYNGSGFSDFLADIRTAFQGEFPDVSLNDYQNFFIIYGGEFTAGMLTPKTILNYSIISEQTPANQPFFTHVGVYAHEFGHQLGAFDEYRHQSPDKYDPMHWSLMAQGEWNGEDVGSFFNNAACPSGFSPYYRILWGWVDPIYLSGTEYEGFVIDYDYQNPKYFRLDIPGSEEYFILEDRLKEGFDRYTPFQPDYIPTDPGEINGNQGGLLIWHIDPNAYPGAYGNILSDIVELEFADGSNLSGADEVGDPFPYNQNNLNGSGLNFSNYTTPSSKLRDGITTSSISLNNISWNTLNKTIAIDIFRNYGLSSGSQIICSDTVWSGALLIPHNVCIMGGISLTVQAGTIVDFAYGKTLTLMPGSRLNILGTKTQPVNFQSADSANLRWKGILVKNSDAILNIHYLIIMDAVKAIKLQKRFDLTLENITFINNNFALDVQNENKEALIQFRKCKFHESKIDILNTNNKKVQLAISNCIFENSKISSFNNHLQLINNTFVGTSRVATNHDILILKNNIFYGLTEYLTFGSPPETYEIQYNCFSSLHNQDTLYLSQTGNFYADPRFVDQSTGDYHLLPASPCIDAGDPQSDYSQEPEYNGGRINLGRYGNTAEAATTSLNKIQTPSPQEFVLYQNYPNPFNPATTIEFSIPKSENVTLNIYDILGEEVATLVSDRLSAGSYQYEWSRTSGIASGVYLYRLQAGEYVETRKMVLMK